MFRSLRWRLALWFVFLSTLVYIGLTSLGVVLFHSGLTVALDDELRVLASEIVPAIDLRGQAPDIAGWEIASHAEPFKLLATIQLFDRNGVLIEQFGPEGIPKLIKGVAELGVSPYRVRTLSVPLARKGKTLGFLQIQLPTRSRDRATRQYGLTMALIAPLLLLGLGVSGYVFSGQAARPIEESFLILRRFMADAGHELSTPISIIQANAEAMEPDLKEKDVPGDRLAVIERSTQRMGNLVGDLTLLSKMESPELVAPRVPVQLEKIVGAIVEEFGALFQAKDICLVAREIQFARVLGHSDSLRRMLANLLENALRYTESGGTVTVSLNNSGRNVRVSVQDTGIGIPLESLPHVFDRFYRVDESRSRAAGGSGLGLSIVKAIAELHGGKVEVESQVEQGSTFTVTLPALG